MSTNIAGEWFYARNGQQQGPVSFDVLRTLVSSGQVAPSDLVWTEGMAEWQQAGSITELASGFAQLHPQAVNPHLGYASPPVNPLQYSAMNTQMVYAGFWWRVLAAIIDQVILSVGGGIVGGIIGAFIGLSMGATREMEMVAQLAGNVIGIIIGWLYSALLESSSSQATLGKMACGLVVTDMQGQRISFGRATGRHFGKFVSAIILLIGYFMVGFTEKKQGLHDMMASTLVYKK